MLDNILSKIEYLAYSKDDKTVNQTVLVRPRHGLGYRGSSENETEELVEFGKIRDEMAQRNESLSLALQTSKERAKFLEEKVRVIEEKPQGHTEGKHQFYCKKEHS